MANDNFLRLGGDSLRAISLVAAARAHGLPLTVADVFQYVKLQAMALAIQNRTFDLGIGPSTQSHYGPALLSRSAELFLAICEIETSASADYVEVNRPCTPIQQNMLTATKSYSGFYEPELRFTAVLSGHHPDGFVDVQRLRNAWVEVVARHSIMRTMSVPSKKDRTVYYQVVLRSWDPEVFVNTGEGTFEDLFNISRWFKPPH